MTVLHPALQILAAAIVIVGAAYDLKFRRIPNWLVLIGLVAGFALNIAFSGLTAGPLHSAKGLGLAFLIYFPLYLLGGMGAGDVKFMGAIGAIVGPRNWFIIFVFSALLGGVFAIILILAKGRFRRTFWNIGYLFWELAHLRPPRLSSEELDVSSPKALTLPHGAVIGLGTLIFLACIWLIR